MSATARDEDVELTGGNKQSRMSATARGVKEE